MRILVVEDDQAIALPLRRSLEREGYEVRVCEDGTSGLNVARVWNPEVVLLDLQLPDMDGREIARELRAFSTAPILMVTGLGDVEDRIEGLDAGATDYVVKPFAVAELLARIRAATRPRAAAADPGATVTAGDVTLDVETKRALRDNVDLGLSAKEFELLRILASRAGEIVRRADLARAVWGVSLADSGNTLDVHVSWLRKKLGDDPKDPRYIQTVRGVGFRFGRP